MNIRKITCLLLLLTPILYGEACFAEENLTFGIIGVKEESRAFKLGEKILEEISKRMGVSIKLITLPPKRATLLLKSGEIDAELSRIGAYKKTVPSATMVNEPITQISFFGYSNKNIKYNDTESLLPYRIVAIRGLEIFKRKFKNHDISYVDSLESAFKFILADRADVLVSEAIISLPIYKAMKMKEKGVLKLKQPVMIIHTHTFFSYQHNEMPKKYEKALIEIKKDGTYDKIIKGL